MAKGTKAGTKVVALSGACAIAVCAALGAGSVWAQADAARSVSDAARATSAAVPRTAEDRPDLSGIWVATGALALMEGPDALRAALEADEAAGYEEPATEPPPYTPEAEAKRQEYLDRQGIDDPMAQCLLTGVPRINFRPLPFEIVQLANRIIMLYEIHHAFRIIPTDGRPHPDYIEPTYLGEPVGHWEGDTLVVEVIGFNDDTWLAGTGTWHSEELRVTERWTRISSDMLAYEVMMEDPAVFTKPWRMYETFRLRPDERIREYECIESNEDIVRFRELLESGDEAFIERAE
ncbi:MAG TPA: hypothetical protein VMR74_07090 [Gammaproteobacteria bacterium]|nr:hypothetical protein [Gammaproteobacteria bacterium]